MKRITRQVDLTLQELMTLIHALDEYNKEYIETLMWLKGADVDEVTEGNKELRGKLQEQVNDLIKVKSWKKSQVTRRHLIKRK